jgi:hypothetical protein
MRGASRSASLGSTPPTEEAPGTRMMAYSTDSRCTPGDGLDDLVAGQVGAGRRHHLRIGLPDNDRSIQLDATIASMAVPGFIAKQAPLAVG